MEQVVPLSLTERLLVAGRAVWFYVGKTLWPHPLIPIYPRWRIEGGWLWTLPATVVVSVVLLWRLRGRIGRGPLAAWLYYLGTLAPALGFLPIAYFYYSFVADHFQYAASPGLFALVGAGLAALGGRAGRLAAAGPVGLRGRVDEVAGGWMGGIAAALILVSLCGLTWRQTRIYHDRWSLWSYTVAENPGCWMAWADLGDVLCEEGRLRDGIEHYERALAARPDDVETLFRRGVAFGKLADFERAAGDFSRVLQLSPNNVKALYNRGVAYAALLRREEALSDFSAAAARNPNDPVIRNARGEVLMEMGRWADALRDFEQALRLAPGYNTARQNLARVEGKVSGGR